MCIQILNKVENVIKYSEKWRQNERERERERGGGEEGKYVKSIKRERELGKAFWNPIYF